ncbi:DNA replication/repair protein RecF [uncultured Jatrophihabitans sp.]|uniref:DNA replication/repair protein RecF n=1 Tax=uncultured Jatrophihabitans sp. TaxID=1610747 RepID=UPI0035CC1D93
MHVRHLQVADFRSWAGVDVALDTGPSVLTGANGQGKTNLVEAVGFLATLASHRVGTDAPLVRMGAERAVVQAAVVADGRELRVEVQIVPGRANKASLNGSPVSRPREILGIVRTVLFAPEDLAIVRGDPGERRRFLDDLVVTRSPRMAGVRADYERVLKQRAALLKTAGAARRTGGADLRTLDVWDGHLAAHGAQLLRARLDAVADLQPVASAAYAQVAVDADPLTLRYRSAVLNPGDGTPDVGAVAEGADVPTLEQTLLTHLERMRSSELDRGVNLVGPHRDDLDLALGVLPVRGYASHGEGWSVALALRLGSYELLRADALPGGDPILILDDVFAELDSRRREQLAHTAAKAEQAIITAAVPEDVPRELSGAHYVVTAATPDEPGSVRRA